MIGIEVLDVSWLEPSRTKDASRRFLHTLHGAAMMPIHRLLAIKERTARTLAVTPKRGVADFFAELAHAKILCLCVDLTT